MACPRCKQKPCACPPPSALDILASTAITPLVLAHLGSNEMAGLLGASKSTREVARAVIRRRMRGGRLAILDLFSDGGTLYDVQRRGWMRLPQVVKLQSYPFDDDTPPEAVRAGWFLSQIAVSILNTCNDRCYLQLKGSVPAWHYGVVVVTTLILHRGRPILIVALNGGSAVCRGIYEEYCRAAPFAFTVGVHEVHVVHNSDAPHQSLVRFVHERVIDGPDWVFKEWLRNAGACEGQDWHGEQKILQYVEDRFGFDTKKFILCLGISHLGGPCVGSTNRTQHCSRFLNALRERDVAFLGAGLHALMGFWMAGGPIDRRSNPMFKVSFSDFKR